MALSGSAPAFAIFVFFLVFSFLAACFAAELLGSPAMGRKGVCLKNEESQERTSERPPCQDGWSRCRLSRIPECSIRVSVWPRAARQRRRSASWSTAWKRYLVQLVGTVSRHVQVFGGERWCYRCVGDGLDRTEVSTRILAQ